MPTIGTKKTAYQIAQEEVRKEKQAKAVEKLKDKLRELDKAELIVANIQRELDDLKAQIDQGDVGE